MVYGKNFSIAYNTSMNPEKCKELKIAQEELNRNPESGQVECDHRPCYAIIGFSKKGAHSSNTERGVAHITGGLPRCRTIEATMGQIDKNLERTSRPVPEETRKRLEEERMKLNNEAGELGIL